ncbi:MAG TPA: DUF1343 domain-containing protein [Opitutaceae bacterium]|nr:DUF1343 domain-containing protein [Opitutaceae bacterium]
MFTPAAHPPLRLRFLVTLGLALCGFGCTEVQPLPAKPAASVGAPVASSTPRPAERVYPVMLGIDVLEADGFAAVRGKRLGLLTHPAGVNRRGVSTIDTLRRAPGVQLVALYAVEHGIDGTIPASKNYQDSVHAGTGLPLFSLYNGKSRKPTPAQLKSIDALVIDLQDIGTRSYTFVSAMKVCLEACFENGKEVIVLDRPNPLGGLKVDGPPLDADLMSYVGSFRVPYVHGLTIGELATLAKDTPGVLSVPESIRTKGRLTVVPMKGWRRAMRWPETGLKFVPTSPYVRDFAATVGYAMTGLGCEIGGFQHGIGTGYPFRTLSYPKRSPEDLKRALDRLRLPGVSFSVVGTTDSKGNPMRGVYTEITDWNAWRPTELSLYLMQLAAAWNPQNPFAAAKPNAADLFRKHTGSRALWQALVRDGAKTNVALMHEQWRQRALAYQQQTRRYWLYQP